MRVLKSNVRRCLALANRTAADRETIKIGQHYPVPLHFQRRMNTFRTRGDDFEHSENVVTEIISLPMFPALKLNGQRRIIDQLVALVLTRAPSALPGVIGDH